MLPIALRKAVGNPVARNVLPEEDDIGFENSAAAQTVHHREPGNKLVSKPGIAIGIDDLGDRFPVLIRCAQPAVQGKPGTTGAMVSPGNGHILICVGPDDIGDPPVPEVLAYEQELKLELEGVRRGERCGTRDAAQLRSSARRRRAHPGRSARPGRN